MSIRIYYLRDGVNIRDKGDGTTTRGNPVVCIVSEYNGEEKKIKYNFSALYPGDRHGKGADHFDKERARCIAVGRLEKKPIVVEVKDTPKKGFEINKLIISDLAEKFKDRKFSQIKDTTQLWLDKSKVEITNTKQE